MEIARQIDRLPRRTSVKLIEVNKNRAEFAAENLENRVILWGDGLNKEVLEEAGVGSAHAVLTVTQDDKTNILAACRAKQLSPSLTAISLINEASLTPLINKLSIDAMIDPRDTTVSSVLPHIRMKPVTRVGFIDDSQAVLVEATIVAEAPVGRRSIRDSELPEGVMIGAIKRGGEVIWPDPDTSLKANDQVAFFALTEDVPELLGLLRPDAAAS